MSSSSAAVSRICWLALSRARCHCSLPRRCRGASAVATDQVEAGHRHVELGVVGVGEGEELLAGAVHRQGLQAQVAAHPVIDVYHGSPGLELGEVPHHHLAALPGAAPAAALHDLLAEQLGFGDHPEGRLVEGQAPLQGERGDGEALLPGDEFPPVGHPGGSDPSAAQELQQGLAAAGGLGAEKGAVGALHQQGFEVEERIGGTARRTRKSVGCRLAAISPRPS